MSTRRTRTTHAPLRRRALCAIAGALALMAAGCGYGTAISGSAGSPVCTPSDGPVRLTMWTWVPGIEKTIAVWNRAHPDVQVDVVPTPADGLAEKLLNSVAAGQPPDLFQAGFQQVVAFRTQQAVQDIAECPGVREVGSRFVPWTWQQVTGDGGVWAIPQDTGPTAMLYRKDLFEQYGIAVPRTWDDFAAAGERLRAASPERTFVNIRKPDWFLTGLAWQAGARWFTQDGKAWTVGIDDPATTRMADYWQDLIDSGTASAFKDDAWEQAAYRSGNLVTVLAPVWYLPILQSFAPETAGTWAAAPMPEWEPGVPRSANMGGSTSMVMRGTRHPAEAARFAVWLNTDPVALRMNADQAGLFPASVEGQAAITATPELAAFYGGQDVYQVYREASEHVDPEFAWGPIQPNLRDAVQAVLSRGAPLREAFADANTRTVRDLQIQSQPVVTR
ncbi:sugar ABC transporter substrate-binding protein [Actinomycetes bacterium KLBMP 9759]